MERGNRTALVKIVEIYPHVAYAAFIHSIKGKWQFIMRTVDNVGKLFQPIEDIITQKLIPVRLKKERKLLSLPTRYGGLNIVNPVEEASLQLDASRKITEPLKKMIIEQSDSYRKHDLSEIKAKLRQQKANQHANKAKVIRDSLPATKQRTMDLLNEKGASSWLTVLPLKEHGFNLKKSEFRDALCLRYDWKQGFWCRQQSAFFYIRVFHPNAPSYRNSSIPSLYIIQEQMKKR